MLNKLNKLNNDEIVVIKHDNKVKSKEMHHLISILIVIRFCHHDKIEYTTTHSYFPSFYFETKNSTGQYSTTQYGTTR